LLLHDERISIMETENRNETETTNAPARNNGWGRRIMIGGVALAALAGVGLAVAWAGDFGRGMDGFSMSGRHFMLSSMGHHRGGFGERRLDYMLEAIDATPEQAEKIKTIVKDARGDMRSTADGFMDARDQFADILGAATIDRAAAEKLRSERIQAIDEASKKLTTALLDAAEVLTPQQRAELLEHFKERRAFGRW